MPNIITTLSPKETKEFAQKIAQTLKVGDIIALSGELGAGKTTFMQGVAEYFGITEHVSSPTFTLINEYNTPKARCQVSGVRCLVHIDCYRLETPRELVDIGIEEYFSRKNVIIFIEWGEKVKKILPQKTKWISFKFLNGEHARYISVT